MRRFARFYGANPLHLLTMMLCIALCLCVIVVAGPNTFINTKVWWQSIAVWFIGGAILPSLLHQDPRFFYKATGTVKSRILYSVLNPFRTKGDNGKWQPNYSGLGGYLASGAISNLYYPESNRGVGQVFATFGVDIAADMANGLIQEFLLRKLTPSAKNRP